MRTRGMIGLALILSIGAFSSTALAASADDFKAAFAKAAAANAQAGVLQNQWTTTAQELKAAQAAAASGNYDEGIKKARQAEALAKASIAQAKEQATAWKQAVIR